MKAQRKMLRKVLASPRRVIKGIIDGENSSNGSDDVDSDGGHAIDDSTNAAAESLEPWVDWIKRTTHQVEHHLQKLHVECWVAQVRRKRWKWAQRVSSLCADRWAKVAAQWKPELHFDGLQCRARRRQARPKHRWDDDLNVLARQVLGQDSNWMALADDKKHWDELEERFVKGEWRETGLDY